MSSRGSRLQFPKGLKLYLTGAAIVFVLGYIVLIVIEQYSFIDAFYFLIVTITTVGYGDFTPQTPATKLIVSILIIIFISSFALVSEQIVSRIVAMNSQQDYSLPDTALDYHNHIVICGFTKIAENIALLFQARFFRILILDPHEVAVERARNYGLEAFLAKPEQASVLQLVNIEDAIALYLFMDDENTNVLTSLQARSLSGDKLRIYASTDHELSIAQGNLIGIDRTYHYERIVASNIRFSLSKIIAFALPNQLLSSDAYFFQMLVSKDFEYKDKFDNYFPVGMLDKTLTEFTPIEEIGDIDNELDLGNLLIITVPRAEAETHLEEHVVNTPVFQTDEETVDSVIIGSYSPTSKHIIHELEPEIIANYEFKVLCFTEDDAVRARNDGFEVIYTERESLREVLDKECTSSTLMVNLFDRLTDSLLVNTVIADIEKDIFIVQLAYNRIETSVLIKSGVDRILIPDVLMSRGMFLILLSSRNLINSMVYGNAHMFEHYIDHDSPLRGKHSRDLSKLNYTILLYRHKDGSIDEHIDDLELQEGGSVLLYRKHQILRAADQFIDKTHH